MTSGSRREPPLDTDRIIADFLADAAPPDEPPILLPAVLARTALTPRRPAWRIGSWWSGWRVVRPLTDRRTSMSIVLRVAVAALLVLAGGWYLVAVSPGPSQVGGAPSPSASPRVLTKETPLEPGATYAMDGPFGPGSPRMVFTVPGEGWSTKGVWNVGKDLPGGSFHDVAMTPWRPDQVFADPCRWQSGEMLPDVGPTVEDLAAALERIASGIVTSTTDATVGGYPGKRFELTFPPELDVATACDSGELWRWWEGQPDNRGGYMYGDQQTIVDYIVDVDGIRGVIDTMYLPGVPEADIAEMEALVESIRFEWPEVSPLASPGSSPAT